MLTLGCHCSGVLMYIDARCYELEDGKRGSTEDIHRTLLLQLLYVTCTCSLATFHEVSQSTAILELNTYNLDEEERRINTYRHY